MCPHNPDEDCSFLGYATYYTKIVKNFAHIVKPINKLLIKERQFHWTKDCKRSLTTINATFANTITVAYPNFAKPFIVNCDASDFNIGGVLLQTVTFGVKQLFCISAASCNSKDAITRLPATRYWRRSLSRSAIFDVTFSVKSLNCAPTTAHSNGLRRLKRPSVTSLG